MTNTQTIVFLKAYVWLIDFPAPDMNNEILCAIDFSDASKSALKWSIDLAKRLQSHITILYTYRLNKQNEAAIPMKKKMEEEALLNFNVLERELLVGKGITYNFKTEVGFVADRVEEHAKKKSIGFLVMGKGMTIGSKEAFEELMEQLQVPLIIVP